MSRAAEFFEFGRSLASGRRIPPAGPGRSVSPLGAGEKETPHQRHRASSPASHRPAGGDLFVSALKDFGGEPDFKLSPDRHASFSRRILAAVASEMERGNQE